MAEEDTIDPFLELDLMDLQEWAGEKALSRGGKYQRQGRVHDLVRKGEKTIIAWVDGTRQYTTAVILDNEISFICTCPVGSACKHAVAVILEYLAFRKENKPVGEIRTGDRRLSLLGNRLDSGSALEPAVHQAILVSDSEQEMQHGAHKGSPGKPISLRQYLEGLQKEDLLSLIEDLIRRYPLVEQDLIDRKSVASADPHPVLTALLSDIDLITAEYGWSNSWSGESQISDYSPIRKRMEILLSMGFPDAVLRAGRILLEKGVAQVERSHDEGETANEIASCMKVVFQALAQSSLPAHERIIFAIHADLDDEYDVCAGAENFWKEQFPERDWCLVADRLLLRLEGERYNPECRKSGSRYKRDKLVNWIMTALDNAGREDEATDLCIAEVERTDSYIRLVRRLLRLERVDEAREWIARGIAITGTSLPGIAADLRTIQRELWEKEGDWLRAAAIRAGDFLDRPSFPNYRQLEESARKAGVGDIVKGPLMQYLETGKLTEKKQKGLNSARKLFGAFPDTGLFPGEAGRERGSPFFDILIDIAIAEKRPEDVITWYDRYQTHSPTRGQWYISDDKVADAIAWKFPDRALDIWKHMAERLIAEARPKSYESAIFYLGKIMNLMKRQERMEEWERYIVQVRTGNVRKRRFLGMLDVLEKKKILKQ